MARPCAPCWRRKLPVGFIRPCEPVLVDRPPAGPGLSSAKVSRSCPQAERAQVWSRRSADLTYRFPTIAEAVRSLSAGESLIDGEAVVLRGDADSDFVAKPDASGSEGPSNSKLAPASVKSTLSAAIVDVSDSLAKYRQSALVPQDSSRAYPVNAHTHYI